MKFLVRIQLTLSELICHIKSIFSRNQCANISKASEIYSALTPTNQANLSEYENALLHALDQKDIKNIAITGPYGSGKSSILRTFEKKYNGTRDYQFLNISLATFDIGNQELDDEKRIKLNSEVEKSLLQQIFFKVTGDELEDSHFSRLKIKRYKQLKLIKRSFLISDFWTAFFLIGFVISFIFILRPAHDIFKNTIFFLPEYLFQFKVFAFFSAIALLQQVLNSFPKMGLSKLGAAGAEISFNEKKGDSILNKFIDELIYFFVKTDYNIVVFEDLDRFPSRDIFIKLREINTLLNYSDDIRKKRKLIKFIFVLGDDVFQKSDDRTKFFDFIIPVIPIINSFNAEEKLRTAVSKAFENHSVEKGFFEDIALFIDDMRMLLNIANEFVIYKKMLDASCQTDAESASKVKLDDTKLLSLIIYKNKYPEDFKELNYRKGVVANIFANKTKFLSDYVLGLEAEVKELNDKLSEIDNEKINSLEELKLTYLAGYFQQLPDMSRINVNGTYSTFGELLNDDLFNTLISQSTINYIYSQQGHATRANKTFNEIEKSINPHITYKQRRQNIIDKTNSKNSETKKRIIELEGRVERANSLKMEDLIQQLPHQDFFTDSTKQGSEDLSLIRFLIVNGYIEEDYDSYMSYFYSGELSTNDKQFLISLASQNPLDYRYRLDNVEKVCQRIHLERFNVVAILNFDLLDYLLIKNLNADALKSVLSVIVRIDYEGYEFIAAYLSKVSLSEAPVISARNRLLINKLAAYKKSYWREFFDALDGGSVKTQLLGLFLENVSMKDLSIVNVDNYFEKYVAHSDTIFEILNALDIDRVKEIIKVLNIKFSDLTPCNNQDILQLVEATEAYQLTDINIIKILKLLNQNADIEVNAGYTCIVDSGRTQLINYVNENLENYAQEILIFVDDSTESESSIRTLLNSNFDSVLVEKIINKFDFKILELDSIENKELWADLLEADRVQADWDNVITYFEYKKEILDESLIAFLNIESNSSKLANVRMNSKDKYVQTLSTKIIYCEKLTNETYRNLLKSVPYYWYPDLGDIEVSNEKIKYLLSANKFQLTKNNHLFLKYKIPEFSYQLIEMNYSEYFKDPSLTELDSQEYESLIDSVILKNDSKLSLVKSIPDAFYEAKSPLTKQVCRFVTTNTTEKVFSVDMTEKLLGFDIEFELKVKLFNLYAKDFDISRIRSIVSKMDKISGLVNKGRPRIPDNSDNLGMVLFLSLHQFLNYKQENNQIKLTPKSKIWN
jgi:hypothetical protein